MADAMASSREVTASQPTGDSTGQRPDTASITDRIITRRTIEGISAILLPFTQDGQIDFAGLEQQLERTVAAGLQPAVNMDTGYVNLLTRAERRAVLATTKEVLAGGPFIVGAFVEGEVGDPLSLYQCTIEEVQAYDGTPILFQCSALKRMAPIEIVNLHQAIAESCPRFLIFELGEMFVPFGQIYSLELVRELMQIPQIAGMKHSSLKRELEWQRLALRNAVRPDFKIYTGNDLAIDMVIYGSDYLLGLSTFAPEAFAARDALWAKGDISFYELNDLLQYLGFFAFRPPVPAYKHNAAQFLKLRGRIASNATHPKAAHRPSADIAILQDIAARLEQLGL